MSKKLGKRQLEVVRALKKGDRLWFEVGQRRGGHGRCFTLTATTRTYFTASDGHSLSVCTAYKDAVLRLVDRDVLKADGAWPRENCFDSTTRRVELVLT